MRSVFAAAAVAAALLTGCAAASPLPAVAAGEQLGVKRGASWTTFKVKPPSIIGPNANLELRGDELHGLLNGRPLHVTIEDDAAHGTGPFGSVDVRIVHGADVLEASGTWNGARVLFRITPESARGTIPTFAGREIGSVQTCQYVLDRVEADGARTGVSTCSGLPQQTRLELPASLRTALKPATLAVVTLALLAVAPTDG